MGWLEFIAAVISSISWPLAIVVIVFLLRHQLRALISSLSEVRIQVAGFAAEAKRLQEEAAARTEIAEEIEPPAPLPQAEDLPTLPSEEEERLRKNSEALRERAQVEPYIAVLEAWLLVELEVQAAGIRSDIDSSTGIDRTLRILLDRGKIPVWVVSDVDMLRNLRAEAARHREAVSPAAALDYVGAVTRVTDRLARVSRI